VLRIYILEVFRFLIFHMFEGRKNSLFLNEFIDDKSKLKSFFRLTVLIK